MKNLEASFRALRVLHTAKDLFNQYGFHKVGVDRIIADSQINKGTFYNYFRSKEKTHSDELNFSNRRFKRRGVFHDLFVQRTDGIR